MRATAISFGVVQWFWPCSEGTVLLCCRLTGVALLSHPLNVLQS